MYIFSFVLGLFSLLFILNTSMRDKHKEVWYKLQIFRQEEIAQRMQSNQKEKDRYYRQRKKRKARRGSSQINPRLNLSLLLSSDLLEQEQSREICKKILLFFLSSGEFPELSAEDTARVFLSALEKQALLSRSGDWGNISFEDPLLQETFYRLRSGLLIGQEEYSLLDLFCIRPPSSRAEKKLDLAYAAAPLLFAVFGQESLAESFREDIRTLYKDFRDKLLHQSEREKEDTETEFSFLLEEKTKVFLRRAGRSSYQNLLHFRFLRSRSP